jgi:hypothetical protein
MSTDKERIKNLKQANRLLLKEFKDLGRRYIKQIELGTWLAEQFTNHLDRCKERP